MADSLDTQVAALKKRITDAQAARARAEQQQVVARDRAAQAEKALSDEYGVRPEEIPALAVQLEADLTARLRQAETLLAKAEEKA
jgi:hypothetical protein